VGPRLADIEAELAALGELRGKPAGTVRITATEHAARALVWPRLLPWLPRYPDIRIEISGDNRFIDIVAERFDIGVRLGSDVAKDMIAVRMAPDMRVAVVGSPDYFARYPRPRTPQDLTEHDCTGLLCSSNTRSSGRLHREVLVMEAAQHRSGTHSDGRSQTMAGCRVGW
jgi:DNA-binding transcriptional LysR family regulator